MMIDALVTCAKLRTVAPPRRTIWVMVPLAMPRESAWEA